MTSTMNLPASDRRTLLRNVMLILGGNALAVPSQLLAKTNGIEARFLDAPRYATLAAVAETMIPRTDSPGARDAGVPEAFDKLMKDWAAPARR